ncbi:hypothetical protein JCM8547_005467 [Rhodosporidiobolus lusitaniae]
MADDSQYAFTIPPPGADDASAPSSAPPPPSAERTKKRKHKHEVPVTGPAATRAAAAAQEEPMAVEGETEGAKDGEAAGEEEERPLSHKEKRLAKKRKLALEAAGEDPDAPAAPAAAEKKGDAHPPTMIGGTLVGNTPARSAHGIWVGNMNYATHPRELLAWFAERGLKEVTRINMPSGKRSHENNRGFAYLDFPSETDVTIAVGLSEQHLDGRKLLIKSSVDYTGRPAPSTSSAPVPASETDPSTLPPLHPSALDPAAPTPAPAAPGAAAVPQTLNRTARKILDKQRNPAGPTLFIGNLGFETTVEDVRDMFERSHKRAAEWAPKEKGKKGETSGKKPGKGKEKAENEDEKAEEGEKETEEVDTDRDDDSSDSEEEEDGEKENEDGEKEEKKKGGKRDKKEKGGQLDLSQAKDAGIRKVRLGTFEDSGKCKGWCFVDFHLPAQSTRALLNLGNHSLNGRKLNVEYASAEAVRRGGLGTRAASKANGRAKREGGEQGAGGRGPKRQRGEEGGKRGGEWDDNAVRDFARSGDAGRDDGRNGDGFYTGPPPARGGNKGARGDSGWDRKKGGAAKEGVRLKSGAALAIAQRASEAIVQSTGRKMTFDD